MLNSLALYAVLAPLLAALITGFGNKSLSKNLCNVIACGLVGISCALAFAITYSMLDDNVSQFEFTLYNWMTIGQVKLEVGFLVDRLTALMMIVVTFVSFMVHIYTIGYMADDSGYQRFFSYISLFTFAMLMLIMSNNFVQLFFGWEGVGLVSYLLIGFWFQRESAVFANLKAFLVNRIGDFGFILGIAGIFYYFGTFNYQEVFQLLPEVVAKQPMLTLFGNTPWSAITVICICLFIGAMAKSAQVPLHVWLPDSMEGPTPISALIHAATMVTAGVFMVARMSMIFEYSEVARSFILVIGASTALFMGILGLVQSDIKRIIAYSTLSQLGYMVTALGVSAYSIAIFHLFTHAFFKALLFLGAGSVIIAMHHEQNIWKMGNLRKYMPITFWTFVVGSLAIIGTPFFSGFYSKDLVIEAVQNSTLPGAGFASFAVLAGVFITALYSFRMLFVVFFTEERMDEETKDHLHESPLVVWLPLVLLAIPSFCVGIFTVSSFIFDEHDTGFFRDAIKVLPENDVVTNHLSHHFESWYQMALHSVMQAPFWLALSGVVVAYLLYVWQRHIPGLLLAKLRWVHTVLINKYGFDLFNEKVIARFTRQSSQFIANKLDMGLIDNNIVNGSAKSVGALSSAIKKIQSGYLYNYTFMMILGLLVLVMLIIW